MLHQQVVAFICTNVTPLLAHWDGSLDSFSLLDALQPPGGSYDVEDMESAAVASVANGKAPFIAFRSPSDSAKGDPLVVVPGPFGFLPQFLAYRQYAADNAAAAALAFLKVWKA